MSAAAPYYKHGVERFSAPDLKTRSEINDKDGTYVSRGWSYEPRNLSSSFYNDRTQEISRTHSVKDYPSRRNENVSRLVKNYSQKFERHKNQPENTRTQVNSYRKYQESSESHGRVKSNERNSSTVELQSRRSYQETSRSQHASQNRLFFDGQLYDQPTQALNWRDPSKSRQESQSNSNRSHVPLLTKNEGRTSVNAMVLKYSQLSRRESLSGVQPSLKRNPAISSSLPDLSSVFQSSSDSEYEKKAWSKKERRLRNIPKDQFPPTGSQKRSLRTDIPSGKISQEKENLYQSRARSCSLQRDVEQKKDAETFQEKFYSDNGFTNSPKQTPSSSPKEKFPGRSNQFEQETMSAPSSPVPRRRRSFVPSEDLPEVSYFVKQLSCYPSGEANPTSLQRFPSGIQRKKKENDQKECEEAKQKMEIGNTKRDHQERKPKEEMNDSLKLQQRMLRKKDAFESIESTEDGLGRKSSHDTETPEVSNENVQLHGDKRTQVQEAKVAQAQPYVDNYRKTWASNPPTLGTDNFESRLNNIEGQFDLHESDRNSETEDNLAQQGTSPKSLKRKKSGLDLVKSMDLPALRKSSLPTNFRLFMDHFNAEKERLHESDENWLTDDEETKTYIVNDVSAGTSGRILDAYNRELTGRDGLNQPKTNYNNGLLTSEPIVKPPVRSSCTELVNPNGSNDATTSPYTLHPGSSQPNISPYPASMGPSNPFQASMPPYSTSVDPPSPSQLNMLPYPSSMGPPSPSQPNMLSYPTSMGPPNPSQRNIPPYPISTSPPSPAVFQHQRQLSMSGAGSSQYASNPFYAGSSVPPSFEASSPPPATSSNLQPSVTSQSDANISASRVQREDSSLYPNLFTPTSEDISTSASSPKHPGYPITNPNAATSPGLPMIPIPDIPPPSPGYPFQHVTNNPSAPGFHPMPSPGFHDPNYPGMLSSHDQAAPFQPPLPSPGYPTSPIQTMSGEPLPYPPNSNNFGPSLNQDSFFLDSNLPYQDNQNTQAAKPKLEKAYTSREDSLLSWPRSFLPRRESSISLDDINIWGAKQDISSIVSDCASRRALWEDPEFPACDSSVFFSRRPPRPFQWKRPHEIVNGPKFIVDGVSRFDVMQGELGNCWLLAAVANLTLNKDLLYHVIPQQQDFDKNYTGVFYFRFWQYGAWTEVVIDDRLPTYNGRLVFLHSKDKQEFWSALLEKAYAKLHGSYEALKGGTSGEAMEDFTGGLSELYTSDSLPKNFYKVMKKAQERSSLMTCSIEPDPQVAEKLLPNGLIRGHAYSITDVKRIRIRERNTILLIRLRNPWGDAVEWKGPWADKSSEWKLIPSSKKEELGLTFTDDGEFWMSYDDFIKNFEKIEICHLDPSSLNMIHEAKGRSWQTQIFEGSWIRGATAGGCRNFPGTFWHNPQYCVTLEEPDDNEDDGKCTLIVAVMQKDRRKQMKYGVKHLTIGFTIYYLKEPHKLPKPLDYKFITSNVSVARSPSYIDTREVLCRFKLVPGTYCIIPSTFDPNEEGDFILRVFSEKRYIMEENDEEVGMKKLDKDHGERMMKSEDKKVICDAFRNVAGNNIEIDWFQLQKLLDIFLDKEFHSEGFGKDVCRSLVAMVDTDRSGRLGLQEFMTLWDDVKRWIRVFLDFDKDKSGFLDSYELREALNSAGYKLNFHILTVLTLRYGEDGKIACDDFILCAVKLKNMIETFNKKIKKKKKEEAKFTLEEWIQETMYC